MSREFLNICQRSMIKVKEIINGKTRNKVRLISSNTSLVVSSSLLITIKIPNKKDVVNASGNRLKLCFNGFAINNHIRFKKTFIVYLLGLIPGFDLQRLRMQLRFFWRHQ